LPLVRDCGSRPETELVGSRPEMLVEVAACGCTALASQVIRVIEAVEALAAFAAETARPTKATAAVPGTPATATAAPRAAMDTDARPAVAVDEAAVCGARAVKTIVAEPAFAVAELLVLTLASRAAKVICPTAGPAATLVRGPDAEPASGAAPGRAPSPVIAPYAATVTDGVPGLAASPVTVD
jgi:hypothetical protein